MSRSPNREARTDIGGGARVPPKIDPALVRHIRVVREAQEWVVIDKPAGVLSVPGKGDGKDCCAAAWCRERYPRASGPITVHRLDMETSGLLLMGLTVGAQRELSRQFEERRVDKAYVAVVAGRVDGEEGVIDVPIRADVERRPLQVVDFERGRPAQTRWRVTERVASAAREIAAERTRLELLPETGRTHQLRLHCAAPRALGGLACAIVGDTLYGASNVSSEASAHVRAGRLLLHASRLAFDDPATGERVRVESVPPF